MDNPCTFKLLCISEYHIADPKTLQNLAGHEIHGVSWSFLFLLGHLLASHLSKSRAVPSGIPMTSRCLGPTVQESWKSIVWLDSARKGLRSPKRPGADSRYCLGSAGNQTWKQKTPVKNNWSTYTVHSKLRCVALYYYLGLFDTNISFLTGSKVQTSYKWSVQLWRIPSWAAANDVQRTLNLCIWGCIMTQHIWHKSARFINTDPTFLCLVSIVLALNCVASTASTWYNASNYKSIVPNKWRNYSPKSVCVCAFFSSCCLQGIWLKNSAKKNLAEAGRNCCTAFRAKVSLAMFLQVLQLIRINSTSCKNPSKSTAIRCQCVDIIYCEIGSRHRDQFLTMVWQWYFLNLFARPLQQGGIAADWILSYYILLLLHSSS